MLELKMHVRARMEAEPRRAFTSAELAAALELTPELAASALEALVDEGVAARIGDRFLLDRRRRGLPSSHIDPSRDRRAS